MYRLLHTQPGRARSAGTQPGRAESARVYAEVTPEIGEVVVCPGFERCGIAHRLPFMVESDTRQSAVYCSTSAGPVLVHFVDTQRPRLCEQ